MTKLTELIDKPLSAIVKEMELVDAKIHSDDKGEIKCIELKYQPIEKR